MGRSKTKGRAMTRQRLPNRRACESLSFTHGGMNLGAALDLLANGEGA
jgi:hypothetical protein